MQSIGVDLHMASHTRHDTSVELVCRIGWVGVNEGLVKETVALNMKFPQCCSNSVRLCMLTVLHVCCTVCPLNKMHPLLHLIV
jgi:hypothetical protein